MFSINIHDLICVYSTLAILGKFFAIFSASNVCILNNAHQYNLCLLDMSTSHGQ